MKKLLTAMAVLMMLGAGTVLAAESRAIVIDETTSTVNLYDGGGAKIGYYTHYSTYGAPTSSSTNQVITNSVSNITKLAGDGSSSTSKWLEDSKQTACASGTYYGTTRENRHRY